MMSKKLRNPALDIIRSVALFFVICVHFFLNSGFYGTTVSGKCMFVMCILRSSFMICVPLFLMLSGYLIQSKETNKNYYKKIVRIIYTYLGACVVCELYRVCFLKYGFSVVDVLTKTFSFQTAPYSWYIEMYIGLFLLIPFLNTMYDGLCTQRKKKLLIATLLTLTALPGVLNIYRIDGLEWWLMPSKVSDYFTVVPDSWLSIYPLTYFFIGKYLREFPVNLKAKQLAFLIVVVFFAVGTFNYYRSYGSTFLWGPWQEYYSLLIVIQAVLVFSFLLKVKYEKLPSFLRNMFSIISDLSLGAYLTSWVFDAIIYSRLNALLSTMEQKLVWFPVVVVLVLTGSLLCSYLINLSYSLTIKKFIGR